MDEFNFNQRPTCAACHKKVDTLYSLDDLAPGVLCVCGGCGATLQINPNLDLEAVCMECLDTDTFLKVATLRVLAQIDYLIERQQKAVERAARN
jgi:hypothetical protein